jgi:hypothetical protein
MHEIIGNDAVIASLWLRREIGDIDKMIKELSRRTICVHINY